MDDDPCADDRRTTLLAMAHELGTPLALISGYLSLWRDGDYPALAALAAIDSAVQELVAAIVRLSDPAFPWEEHSR